MNSCSCGPTFPPGWDLEIAALFLHALLVVSAVLMLLTWSVRLPEWLFPLKGRWLRYFLTGVLVAVMGFAWVQLSFGVGLVSWPLAGDWWPESHLQTPFDGGPITIALLAPLVPGL